jgi:thiosulfate dehydrogenase [quinone] large subunit
MQFLASIQFIGPLVAVIELVIGLSLLLGLFTRIGSIIGAFMMLLFYYGNADWGQGLLNSDMMYLILLLSLVSMKAGEKMSLDSYILQKYEIENKILKKVLGL